MNYPSKVLARKQAECYIKFIQAKCYMKGASMAHKDEQTNVRLPVDLKDWLKAQASAARRSVTAELIMRLEESRRLQKAGNAQPA